MKEKQVDELLRFWQHRLRLRDWRIKLIYRHRKKGEDHLGRINMTPRLKLATVFIAKRTPSMREQDPIELVVIHELIHLHLVAWEPRKMKRGRFDSYEAAIDCLAWGLYKTRLPTAVDPHIGK